MTNYYEQLMQDIYNKECKYMMENTRYTSYPSFHIYMEPSMFTNIMAELSHIPISGATFDIRNNIINGHPIYIVTRPYYSEEENLKHPPWIIHNITEAQI